MVHKGAIFIDIRQVFGNVKKFVELYGSYIAKPEMEKLDQIIELSKRNTGISDSSNLLELKSESRNERSEINQDFISSLNVIVAAEAPAQDRR